MAKSKKSRRIRRQEAAKQRQSPATNTTTTTLEDTPSLERPISPKTTESVAPAPRKGVDFAQEYFYVYTELRNILIVAVLMFLVMVGLSFVV